MPSRLRLLSTKLLRGASGLAVATLLSPTPWLPAQERPASEPVRYGRDIRPILSDRCFHCHGPDPNTREAGLRLDRRDDALAARRDGAAIVPGQPAASALLARITCADDADRMPPPSSGRRRLNDDEVALVERWIAEGASYEAHWSFVPPQQVPLPKPGHPVDAFLDHTLQRRGIAVAPEADRATLARRLFLTVTGLPPTPDELAAFVADPRPDAYDQLVDRLFDQEPYRTRHAEHLATPWLDAARYADTSGIHMDAGRQIWPWRDWLLAALRDDLPFDTFVRDQLAGDLLPGATQEQIVATGFLRNHVTTDEGGAIDEEYRIEYAAERTGTLGSVFLGMTLSCARCHDHKYDPISQDDFYKLLAFFDKNDEPGLYSQVPDPNRALEPALAVPSQAQRDAEQRLAAAIATAQQDLDRQAPGEAAASEAFFAGLLAEAGLQWQLLRPTAAAARRGATLTVLDDGSVLASGANPDRDAHTLDVQSPPGQRLLVLQALPDPSLPHGKVGRAENGNAVLTHVQLEQQAADGSWQPVPLVWARADVEQPDGDFAAVNVLAADARGWAIDAHRRDAGPRRLLLLADREFGGALRATLHYDSVYARHTFGRVRLSASPLAEAAAARLPVAVGGFFVAGPFADGDRERLYAADHGPAAQPALDLTAKFGEQSWRSLPELRDGQPYNGLAQGSNVHYVALPIHAPTARELRWSLGSDDGFVAFVDGQRVAERRVDRGVAADQDSLTAHHRAGVGTLTLAIVNTGGQGGVYLRRVPNPDELPGDTWLALLPGDALDVELQGRLRTAWREHHSPDYRQRRDALAALTAELATLQRSVPQTMVMREAAQRRQTYVLMRGEYDKPDRNRPVEPDVPTMFGGLPNGAPRNRLALANWLVGEQHPLLRRVAVNRLWEFVFGTGLVRTSEDFGLQGEWPSHPELLDWLAVEFGRQGFRQRAMLKLLVRSAAFRRSSVTDPAIAELDPDNRLLARFPRRRLPAEALRDQALYVGGLLVERTGGPSVKPYQPPGLWQEVAMLQSNTRTFVRGDGDDLWRRSLYTYWKRACPPPTLLTLDAPTREFCSVRRITSNTPLQALALWNDEQFVEAARALAQRSLQVAGPTDARLAAMFVRCTGHALDPTGLQQSQHLYEQLVARFRDNPADAQALLGVGEHPLPAEVDAAALAALTIVANAYLNLDATLYVD